MMGSLKKASEVASLLHLKPHPEGGFYNETFRDVSINLSKSQLPSHYKVDRPISTAIYFMLPSGSVSHLHRIPCAETWHFYMGEPLTACFINTGDFTVFVTQEEHMKWAFFKKVFELSADGKIKLNVLGTDLESGQKPQYTVPPNVWFGSFPTADIESFSSDGSSLVRGPQRDPEWHYSLVGCTCAPAFQFEDFELASRAKLLAVAPHLEPFISYLTFPD